MYTQMSKGRPVVNCYAGATWTTDPNPCTPAHASTCPTLHPPKWVSRTLGLGSQFGGGEGCSGALYPKKAKSTDFSDESALFGHFDDLRPPGHLGYPIGVPVQGLRTSIFRSRGPEKCRFRGYPESAKIVKNVPILVPGKVPILDLFWTLVRNAKLHYIFGCNLPSSRLGSLPGPHFANVKL
jgi:hypothetical protein